MKILKLGQSLGGSNAPSAATWLPSDEGSLTAWYQKGVGITLSGSDVSIWLDSSTNSNDMRQTDATEMPAYSAGVLTFDGTGENMQTAGQVSLSGDFTIGAKINVGASLGTLLGDNTTVGEWLRFINTTDMRVKIDNASAVDLSLNGGLTWGDGYIVITRRSGTLNMYWKGALQTDTETLTGTADIDAIGVRKTDLNPYNGTVEEIQIFSSSSLALTANVNARLLSL